MQEADKPGARESDTPEPDHDGHDHAHEEGTSLSADIQEKLGEKLREVYSDVINEPVPDRFLDLLSQLEGGAAPSEDLSEGADPSEEAELSKSGGR